MVILVNKEDITDSQYGNLITYLEGQDMKHQLVSISDGYNVVALVLGSNKQSICKVCNGTGKVSTVRCTGGPEDTIVSGCFGCGGNGV